MKKEAYHIVILLQHTLPMVPAHMWLTCLSSMFKPDVAHGIFCFHALICLINATHQLSAIVLVLCLLSTSQTSNLLSSTHVIFCFNANASDSMRPLTSVQSCCGYFLQNKISSHPVPILIHARSAPIRGLVDYFWFSYTDLSLSFVYSAARLCGLKYSTRDLSLSNGRSRISTFTI